MEAWAGGIDFPQMNPTILWALSESHHPSDGGAPLPTAVREVYFGQRNQATRTQKSLGSEECLQEVDIIPFR